MVLHSADLIIRLHERGFVYDFALLGTSILWVQENLSLAASEFKILEYHGLSSPRTHQKGSVILGLFIPRYDVKGILINHFSNKSPEMESSTETATPSWLSMVKMPPGCLASPRINRIPKEALLSKSRLSASPIY